MLFKSVDSLEGRGLGVAASSSDGVPALRVLKHAPPREALGANGCGESLGQRRLIGAQDIHAHATVVCVGTGLLLFFEVVCGFCALVVRLSCFGRGDFARRQGERSWTATS